MFAHQPPNSRAMILQFMCCYYLLLFLSVCGSGGRRSPTQNPETKPGRRFSGKGGGPGVLGAVSVNTHERRVPHGAKQRAH